MAAMTAPGRKQTLISGNFQKPERPLSGNADIIRLLAPPKKKAFI
jgi:hypothetical protein